MNEKAKKDNPEAPGPVIGMNDERGGVSFFTYMYVKFYANYLLL